MAHLLAICSRVLYDKQILDDRQYIQTVVEENDEIKQQLRRLKMKYKYLELRHRMECVEEFITDLWENIINPGENAFDILCKLCNCDYEYTDAINSIEGVYRHPYAACCGAECHLVLTHDEHNCPKVHFGKKWWNAKDITEQIPVYLLFYTIEKVYMYTNGWFDEAIFFWVIENFLAPYTKNEKRLMRDAESFEEYYNESETFSLENIFD